MRHIYLIFLFLIPFELCAQSTIKFKFYDSCIDSVVNLKYEMTLLEKDSRPFTVHDSIIINEQGAYMVYVWREKGDYTVSYDFTKIIENDKTYTDTIELPRLSFWFSNTVDFQDLKYHFCDRLCDGHEIDFYKNGQKRIEGNFFAGVPHGRIKFYDREGFLVKIEKYSKKGLTHTSYKDYNRFVNNN
jgi:hypothetical protein